LDHPVRVAFCRIFFGANGGQFDALGRPIFHNVEEDGFPIRGKCDKPFDCGTCSYLGQWILVLNGQGWQVGWECNKCLRDTEKQDKAELQRSLPGFYQSGRHSSLTPKDADYDSDQPPLDGCTRCGWETSFLQLVLRKRKGGT
jgi:hypothetical protein